MLHTLIENKTHLTSCKVELPKKKKDYCYVKRDKVKSLDLAAAIVS